MKRLALIVLAACKSHDRPAPPAPPPLPPKVADLVGLAVHLDEQPMGSAIDALEKVGGHLRPEEMSHQMYEAVELDSDFGPLRVDLRGTDTATGIHAELTLRGSIDALWSELDQAWGKPVVENDVRTYPTVIVKPQGDEVWFGPK